MPILPKPAQYGFFTFDGGLLQQLSDAYGLGPLTGFRPILLDGDCCTLIDVRSQTSRKMVIEGSDRKRLFLGPVPEGWTPLSPAPPGAGEEGSLMVMKVYSP
ncbi:hypothetical protein, partial [Streptomyces sp. NPDC093109]|uniref:hypothetical protein n=1 Tax=Streptomyces sp. NPDC093109 TaxID=3154977 RepID=UPI00344C61BD